MSSIFKNEYEMILIINKLKSMVQYIYFVENIYNDDISTESLTNSFINGKSLMWIIMNV